MLLLIAIQPQLKSLYLIFLLLTQLIQCQCLISEPVALLLEFPGARLLLLYMPLDIGFLFELLHIILDNVHFLLECRHEVLLVLLHYFLYVRAFRLVTKLST
jgi:hypothetical protein